MEDFINELKSNAISKSDFESKINSDKYIKENQEFIFFCNELKNSIMQYSLLECKKGNYIVNNNIRYLCLRIVIHSQFDINGSAIGPALSTEYNIKTINQSKFGIDISEVPYGQYQKLAPFGENNFSDPLLEIIR